MINLDKVIKGLEICSEHGSWHGCDCELNEAYKDCPYRGCETGCVVTIAKDALQLLKEQGWQTKRLTPTEPIVSINAYGRKFYYCPHCKRPILKSGIIGKPRHCDECGQELKWDE